MKRLNTVYDGTFDKCLCSICSKLNEKGKTVKTLCSTEVKIQNTKTEFNLQVILRKCFSIETLLKPRCWNKNKKQKKTEKTEKLHLGELSKQSNKNNMLQKRPNSFVLPGKFEDQIGLEAFWEIKSWNPHQLLPWPINFFGYCSSHWLHIRFPLNMIFCYQLFWTAH